MSTHELAQLLPSVVPFVGKVGITYDHIDATAARLSLKSDASLLNHVGTAHAGALFTLAESASGAVIVSAVGDLLDRLNPVVTASEITFHTAAVGDLVASAFPSGDLDSAIRTATAGEKSELEIRAEVSDGRGQHCVSATFHWVLLPVKST